MAKNNRAIFKHNDDDGDLNLFISKDELLITCSKGNHYWIVQAKQQVPAQRVTRSNSYTLEALVEKFGPDSINDLKEHPTG